MVITENLAPVIDLVARRGETLALITDGVYQTTSAVYTILPDTVPKGILIGPIEAQAIRLTIHGTNPVVATKIGHPMAVGDVMWILGSDNVKNLRVVREAAVTAYIPITYLY
jgi:hypothetical protein